MKDLPIGIQTFENIRSKTANFIYVDKTDFVHELAVLERIFSKVCMPIGKSFIFYVNKHTMFLKHSMLVTFYFF